MPNRLFQNNKQAPFKEDMLDYIPQNYRDQLYGDFKISFSANLLMQMMQQNGLKASDLASVFIINENILINENALQHEAPRAFISSLSQWPSQLNWAQLNEQLLLILHSWLSDYVTGSKVETSYYLLNFISITHEDEQLAEALSLKFRLLLTQLISNVTTQFDTYKFDYWQNFNMETGLPNQKLLLSMLDQILFNSTDSLDDGGSKSKILEEARTKPLGIIVLNLNINFDEAFKLNTNAISVIEAAVRTIKQQLNPESILFQVSSYEFAILIKNLTFSTQMNLIISHLMFAFESTLDLENITLILKPYIGGASTFNPETNAVSLYEHARLALHQAMTQDKQMQIYEQTIGATFTDNHLLEEAILEALQNNELSTYLQPIVTLKNEACETAEILLRWDTKDWPYIPPNRIVDTIYKKGFGKVFIRWLINSACQRSADLQFNHHRTILLTINISVNDLLDQDLPEMISQAIELWEIPAKNIVFEITETDLLTDESEILPALNAIKAHGCQIALDDFGTGNSSMSRLREMPVDYVKIDQMFVRNILNSKHDLEIVKQVIQLAHGLDKGVVCEGVEDIGTVELLNSLGCEKIQGYYYSKPLNFEDFIDWIKAFEKTVTLAAKMRPPAPLQMLKSITKPLTA